MDNIPNSGDLDISNIKFSYTNELLTESYQTFADRQLEYIYTDYTYAYNNGNNITQLMHSTAPDANLNTTDTLTNTSFDNKNNLYQAVPLWPYFKFDNAFGLPPYIMEKNNPVNATENGKNFAYTYVYNSNGYPTTISWNNESLQSSRYENETSLQSYRYEYIGVN